MYKLFFEYLLFAVNFFNVFYYYTIISNFLMFLSEI